MALAAAEQQANKAFNIRRTDEPMDIDEVSQNEGSSFDFSQKLDKLVDSIDQLLAKGGKNSRFSQREKVTKGPSLNGQMMGNLFANVGHIKSKCFSKRKAENQKSEN